jgi:hypothetical protein
MLAGEPRVRHRGFFLHSPDTEAHEAVEQENPEGFVVRVRVSKPAAQRQVASSGRSHHGSRSGSYESADPQIRSGSVTGSRQRAHLHR